jgi:hypothetical protein
MTSDRKPTVMTRDPNAAGFGTIETRKALLVEE